MSETQPTLAKLTMKLSSPTGYQATTEARITPEQWGAIQRIAHDAADPCVGLVAANAALRDDLDSARSNWELAVEAGNDVVQQLEAAKRVQQQLVAALREANDLLALNGVDLNDEADYGNGRADEIVGRIRAALAAAGAV